MPSSAGYSRPRTILIIGAFISPCLHSSFSLPLCISTIFYCSRSFVAFHVSCGRSASDPRAARRGVAMNLHEIRLALVQDEFLAAVLLTNRFIHRSLTTGNRRTSVYVTAALTDPRFWKPHMWSGVEYFVHSSFRPHGTRYDQ